MTLLVAKEPTSKPNDEAFTPEHVLERVRRVAPIAVDPCTILSNPTGAKVIGVSPKTYAAGARHGEGGRSIIDHAMDAGIKVVAQNGLSPTFSWARMAAIHGGLVFTNCPYSRGNLRAWMGRCYHEADEGAEIIALPLCDPSTLWWNQFCVPGRAAKAICFFAGRLTFPPAITGADFPSAAIYYGQRKYRFAAAFEDAGAIWM